MCTRTGLYRPSSHRVAVVSGPCNSLWPPCPSTRVVWESLRATSLLPYAYLASVTQTASLQDRILQPSPAPMLPAALTAQADHCASNPDFDAALSKILILRAEKSKRSSPNLFASARTMRFWRTRVCSRVTALYFNLSPFQGLLIGCWHSQFPICSKQCHPIPFDAAFNISCSSPFSSLNPNAPTACGS